ncbi:MAG: PA14 domain-containing protein [Candidatus Brocadiaceae bacterium]|uniref:PA14 domain-containing protein n=1 Tax=Candidatus Wunengus sp. YC61 TaxID=3367698 RepID=UPI002715C0C1|nr:PA14 domain-containing protein [Candidatus Brocadiaceae bacterium]
MTLVVSFIIISIITGFILTYFLSARYSIFERVAYGTVIGLGLHTWIVYLFSLLWGLSGKSIYISAALLVAVSSVILISKWSTFKEKITTETIDIKTDFLLNKISYFAHIAVFSFFTTIFWRLFYRTIIWKKDGMYVGLTNNYGDLPLHLAYITSFVWGNNIPPQDPSFAGEKLVYPFLADFLSAVFLKLGLDFRDMLFIPGLLLTVAFYCILYYFTYRLTKRRFAAIISVFIFFFTGGFGFYYFFQDLSHTSGSFWSFLTHLPRDYTKIEPLNYYWITPLTCLNVPQRALLFGFPITMLIFTLLYTGIEHKKWREFLFAGVLAGVLPFFHSHSFLAVLMVTIPLGLIFWDWRKWFLFFMPAFILSLPQVLYLSGHVGGGSFFKSNFGWMAGKENFLWFWLKNTSLFWPVLIGGFVVIFVRKNGRSPLRLGFYVLPFLILFLLPNLILFAPWNWDNIKILIYWFLGVTPIAAFAMTCLYESRRYKILSRIGFFIIMVFLTISGAIDIFKYAIAPVGGSKEFSVEEIELAKRISMETPAEALFLNAPVHNHLVFLSGRKTLMGFPGHIWSHGYQGSYQREQDVKIMLKGEPNAKSLIDKYKPSYVTIGPHEKRIGAISKFFDANFTRVITTKSYKVYDLTQKKDSLALSNEYSTVTNKQDLTDKTYGLCVWYYDNANWQDESVFQDVNEHIGFNWSNEDEKPVSSPFSALWKGFIDINTPGKYTFKLTSDDGSWLYINDILVVDNGGNHAMKSVTGMVNLEPGKHKIMIKYFDAGGGAMLSLLWLPPNGRESKIPVDRLMVKD